MEHLKELDLAILRSDLPDAGLRAGDVGVVVHVYAQGQGYEVEFVSGEGRTIAVLTLPSKAVRPFRGKEILHARPLLAASS